MVDILHPRVNPPRGPRFRAPDPGLAGRTLAGSAVGLEVEVLEDVQSFAELRVEWRELLQDSSADCVFLTWEWLYTWWQHLAAGRRLHLITVRRGGRLMGVAPLAVRPRQPKRLFPFLALEFMGTGSVGSDYLDFIVRRGEETAVSEALADCFADSDLMLELSQVKLSSTRVGDFASRLMDEGWSATQAVTDICPYIDLDGHGWDSFLDSLGKSHRYNVRRRLRNLESSFAVTWEQASSEESRQRCFRTLLELHNLRWATRQGSDALHHRELVAFHEEWTRLAMDRGWLRLCLLKLDREPAAAVYGFSYGGVFHFYQSGFDPAYSSHSVGLAALAMSIRCAVEEGTREYDLLHGNEGYKFLWTKQGRDLSRFNIYPPNSSGLIYRQAIRLRQGMKAVVGRPHPTQVG